MISRLGHPPRTRHPLRPPHDCMLPIELIRAYSSKAVTGNKGDYFPLGRHWKHACDHRGGGGETGAGGEDGSSERKSGIAAHAASSWKPAKIENAVVKPKRKASPKRRLPRPKPVKSRKTLSPIACPPRLPPSVVTMPASSGCVMS